MSPVDRLVYVGRYAAVEESILLVEGQGKGSAWKELNLRPASYKDAALTAELHARSWVGGI